MCARMHQYVSICVSIFYNIFYILYYILWYFHSVFYFIFYFMFYSIFSSISYVVLYSIIYSIFYSIFYILSYSIFHSIFHFICHYILYYILDKTSVAGAVFGRFVGHLECWFRAIMVRMDRMWRCYCLPEPWHKWRQHNISMLHTLKSCLSGARRDARRAAASPAGAVAGPARSAAAPMVRRAGRYDTVPVVQRAAGFHLWGAEYALWGSSAPSNGSLFGE